MDTYRIFQLPSLFSLWSVRELQFIITNIEEIPFVQQNTIETFAFRKIDYRTGNFPPTFLNILCTKQRFEFRYAAFGPSEPTETRMSFCHRRIHVCIRIMHSMQINALEFQMGHVTSPYMYISNGIFDTLHVYL